MQLRTEAVIVAAGRGTRLGTKASKAFIPVRGKFLVEFSLDVFEKHPRVQGIVLVVSQKDFVLARTLFTKKRWRKINAIVVGGKERFDSVRAGLTVLDPATSAVLIHDAARPFVTSFLIDRVMSALHYYQAVVPVVSLRDTVKLVDKHGFVLRTLPRDSLRSVQTPQGFRKKCVLDMLRLQNRHLVYDDAMLVEKKIKVKAVEGEFHNIKVTFPEDLALLGSLRKSKS